MVKNKVLHQFDSSLLLPKGESEKPKPQKKSKTLRNLDVQTKVQEKIENNDFFDKALIIGQVL